MRISDWSSDVCSSDLRISANAERNGLADRVSAVSADAFDYLKAARGERRHFDVVILDPPAFVKRKKDLKEGALAYRRLAEAAMQVRSEEHTSELQSLMRISYSVFCLKKKTTTNINE